eukprot:s1963_g13.t1
MVDRNQGCPHSEAVAAYFDAAQKCKHIPISEQSLLMPSIKKHATPATAHFHVAHSNFNDHAKNAAVSHDQQRRALADPMRDTELELQRINALLAQPPIPPPDVPSHLQQGCRSTLPVSTGYRGSPMPSRSSMQLNV